MFEESYNRLARKILNDSLQVKKGENLTIESWQGGLPFARRVLIEAKKKGAHTLLLLEDDEVFIEAAKSLSTENIGIMGQHEYRLLSSTDAYVFIPGPPIAIYTKAVTPTQKSTSTAYNSSWYAAAEKANLRGVRISFGYIGRDLARLYGKKSETIIAHQLRASLIDYKTIQAQGRRIAKALEDDTKIELHSGGKLTFRLNGELVIEDGIVDKNDVSSGNNISYIPPGRIRKGIDSDSVSGQIELSSVETPWGMVEGLQLKFRNGALTSWACRRGKQAILEIFRILPAEKRKVTILELGINPAMKYGFAQDRFVAGSVTIGLPRLWGVAKQATAISGKKELVHKGRLV